MTSLPSQTLPVSCGTLEREASSHGDDGGAGGDVLDQAGVERSLLEVDVVLLGERGRRGERLDTAMSYPPGSNVLNSRNELVALLLESRDDLA
jgi:hypothetical protein